MTRTLARGLVLLCLFLAACGGGEERVEPAGGVLRVRIEGPLDAGTLALTKRALERGRAERCDVLVLELDTPGGAVEVMHTLARLLDTAPEGLRTVAWVRDRALSAGVLVALACDEVFVAEHAVIGAAMPVVPGPAGIAAVPEEGGARVKILSALRAEFRARAEARGLPPALVEAMIDPEIEVREVRVDGVPAVWTRAEIDDAQERGERIELVRTLSARGELLTLTAEESVALRFARARANDFETLLGRIGSARPERVLELARTRGEDLLGLLETWTPVLLALALLFAFTEAKSPGFGLPGILAIALFALLLVGRYLTGLADVPHLVAIGLGIALVAVELFVLPGTLWFGLAGVLLVALGLLLGGLGPGLDPSNAFDRSRFVDGAFELALTASLALVGAWFLAKLLPRTPGLSWLVLQGGPAAARDTAVFAGARELLHARPGARGRTLTDLRPTGKVLLDEDPESQHEARAEGGFLAAGSRVVVVEVREGRLVVAEPAPPA